MWGREIKMDLFLDNYVLIRDNFLDEGLLYEAGISRVLHHTKKPFLVITAFRGNYSSSQNKKRNLSLGKDLHTFKMGGIKLIGHWEEAPMGMDWKEAKKKGKVSDVKEESFFVPKRKEMSLEKFKAFAFKLVKRYDQDAALFGDGKSVFLLFQSGKLDKIGSKLTINKFSQAYSVLRRKPNTPFVFEGTVQPSNNFHRMVMQRDGLLWFSNEDE